MEVISICFILIGYSSSFSLASLVKVTTTSTQQDYSNELSNIYSNLLTKYDTRVRPQSTGGPIVVNVTVRFQSVVDVDETKMDMTVNLVLTQSWKDSRLAFNTPLQSIDSISLSGNNVSAVWLPDTFFANERNAFLHQFTIPNDYIKIFRNGSVSRTMRLTVTVYCPFNYEDFPFDQQTCSIILGSNALTVDDIVYRWDDFESTRTYIPHSRQFFFVSHKLGDHYTPVFSYGKVSRLQFVMELQRSWRPYIPRFFMPMALFTVISMLSLWIADYRISLTINLFLIAFVNVFMGIRYLGKDMPIATTKTALDVYYIICLFFVCFSSVVSLLSIYFENKRKPKKRTSTNSEALGHDNLAMRQNSLVDDDTMGITDNTVLYRPTTYRIRLLSKTQVFFKYLRRFSLFVCKHAKWVLPFGFLLTDIIYFAVNKRNIQIDTLHLHELEPGSDPSGFFVTF